MFRCTFWSMITRRLSFISPLLEQLELMGRKRRFDPNTISLPGDEDDHQKRKEPRQEEELKLKTDIQLRLRSPLYKTSHEEKNDLLDIFYDKIIRYRRMSSRAPREPWPELPMESDYVIDQEKGLRKVYPYFYMYSSYTKRRWIGMKLGDLLDKEFRRLPRDMFNHKFSSSYIRVNNKQVTPDTVLKDNDLITHIVHRHELPVLGAPIKIVHKDKNFLVIDKPPSIPVHPCGKYRLNSVFFILRKELGIEEELKICHRLDRLTSGILIFGLNLAATQIFMNRIRDHKLSKEYVARVVGKFPYGELVCEEPLEQVIFKFGVSWVNRESGRPCKTTFKRLNFNGKSSTVLCIPETGRMHQIRSHLQYLGHPIVNDPLYNTTAFGPAKGAGGDYDGMTQADLIQRVTHECDLNKSLSYIFDGEIEEPAIDVDPDKSDTAQEEPKFSPPEVDPAKRAIALKALNHYYESDSAVKQEEENEKEEKKEKSSNPLEVWSEKYPFDKSKEGKDELCDDCKKIFYDPEPQHLYIYLHAYRYRGEDFDYQTKFPVWAREDWQHD